MNGLPYFRWYPADAETDEKYASMTDQELGFYHRCLNRSWINDGLPSDMDKLAALMRVSRKYLDKLWPSIGKCFRLTDTVHARLVNQRQEEERERALAKSRNNQRVGNANAKKRVFFETRIDSSDDSSRVSNGAQHARARADSDSVSFSGKEECEKETEIGGAAERMYERHPKKKDLPLVPDALANAAKVRPLEEVERVHVAWCATEDWTKENGRYCPSLPTWLFDRGFTRWPEGAEPKKPQPAPKPMKVVPYDPLGIGANGGIPRVKEG